jgi:hypothetical protein
VVQDGAQRVLAHVDQTWSFLSAGSTSWTDLSVSSAVKTDGGSGEAGVAARVLDSNNFYSCQVENGTGLRLVRMVQGKLQVLSHTTRSMLGIDAFNTITMVVKGNQLSCMVNGAPVLHTVDGALTHGRVGLVGLGALPSEFGAVKVQSLPAV